MHNVILATKFICSYGNFKGSRSENDNVYFYKRHLKEINTDKSNICLDLTFY